MRDCRTTALNIFRKKHLKEENSTVNSALKNQRKSFPMSISTIL